MTGPDHTRQRDQGRETLDELSRRWLLGDEEAMHALHARLSPGLRRHFERKAAGFQGVASGEVADELAQRTWILLWDSVAKRKYDPAKSRLTTFLYAASSLIWVRFLAQSQNSAALDEKCHVLRPPAESSQDPAETASIAALLDDVRRVLAGEIAGESISAQDRETLRALAEGHTDRELAVELDISPSTAHARKKSALERLRVFLRNRGHSDD